MPFNGSGSFSLASGAFTPGTTISSSAVNSDFSDLATNGLSLVMTLAGEKAMTAVLPLNPTGFTYSGDTNTGMYRSAADTQIIKCGGIDVFTVTTTGVSVLGSSLPTATSTTTFQNKTLDDTNTLIIRDTQFTIENNVDTTKRARFNLANVLTSTTAVYLMPNQSTNIVGTDTTDTLTNKSITASQLTSATLGANVGFSATNFSNGTVSSGTLTPAASSGNFQSYTNNGAHTLSPPSMVCTIVLECLNGASAGTITTSGFTKVTGDALTTTNTNKFQFFIAKTANYSLLNVVALQ